MSVSRRDLARQSVWFVACIGLLLTALSLSWQSIARADYLYPLWYEWLHISDHIDQFAPQNQQGKLGLDALPAESHHQLFHQIRQSVHRDGDGLRDITYQSASGRVHLLNAEEVVHLHDVARLITLLGHASDWIMPATLILVLLLTLAEISVQWRRQIALLLSLVLLATALVLVLGPTRVFYAMHVWIFPPENPWFFYYQDSLMTTLMKAPQLFGAIAFAVLVGALVWLAVLLSLLWFYQRQLKVWRALKN